mmetsp:Transcript_3415/g.5030  ORF Transcript_3415/g.5030 Transcript_3415/m.5030 type:complete len:461 (-) Transcript_3415:547-1929(-)
MKKKELPVYTYEEVNKHNKEDDIWIVIQDNIYDVTEWVPRHPGGTLIYQYGGKDVTDVYLSFHLPKDEKKKNPYLIGKLDKPHHVHPISKDYRKLREHFLEEGFFESSTSFYIFDTIFIFGLMAAAFTALTFTTLWGKSYLNTWVQTLIQVFLGGFLLGETWHQSGALLHDAEHSQIFHDIKKDTMFGWLWSCVIFGVPGAWWKEEHNRHHAYPNAMTKKGEILDVQQCERPVYAQYETLVPFVNTWYEKLLVSVQHLSFFPLVWWFGRFAIIVDSYSSVYARNIYQIGGLIIHWAWVLYFLSFQPTGKQMLATYFVSTFTVGILHLQLEMNHFCKPIMYIDDHYESAWPAWQIQTSRNVITPLPGESRYHGGLQYQIEHHLFPLMPRHHLLKAKPYVEKLCKDHRIFYDGKKTFPLAIWEVMKHLAKVAYLVYHPEKVQETLAQIETCPNDHCKKLKCE